METIEWAPNVAGRHAQQQGNTERASSFPAHAGGWETPARRCAGLLLHFHDWLSGRTEQLSSARHSQSFCAKSAGEPRTSAVNTRGCGYIYLKSARHAAVLPESCAERATH